MLFLGIDPGKSGGMAIISSECDEVVAMPYAKYTVTQLADRLYSEALYIQAAALERVHSMPAQGVKSTFTFGENFGWWKGVLDTSGISYTLVTPQTWQKDLDCRTGGDKNVTKNKAKELFPGVKVTHAIADALLIAEWARRHHQVEGR